MPDRPAFRPTDLARAIRAAKSGGMDVARAEVWPDGRIVLDTAPAQKPDDPFDLVEMRR